MAIMRLVNKMELLDLWRMSEAKRTTGKKRVLDEFELSVKLVEFERNLKHVLDLYDVMDSSDSSYIACLEEQQGEMRI